MAFALQSQRLVPYFLWQQTVITITLRKFTQLQRNMSSGSEDYSLSEDAAPEAWSDWSDDESEQVKSLFSDDMLPSLEAALKFDAENHGFDLKQYITEVCMELSRRTAS